MSALVLDCDPLPVRPLRDPVVDRLGFDPRSAYVERFWLGVIGPSCTWLLRHTAAAFDQSPDGFDLDLGQTARAIGLGDRTGRNAPMFRTLNRLVVFDLARLWPEGGLAVRRRLPLLPSRYLVRLPAGLQEAHRAWEQGWVSGSRSIAPLRPAEAADRGSGDEPARWPG